MNQERLDELLELMWILGEENIPVASESIIKNRFDTHQPRLVNEGPIELKSIADMAISENLLSQNHEGFSLTEKGKKRAMAIVRRHRLAEKLFTDVLQVSYEDSEEASCKFEHILSDEVVDSVCSFLGHPPLCPHSKQIPKGACCNAIQTSIKPLVIPLAKLDVGKEAKITFISSFHPERLQKLSTLGLVPGENLKIIQKSPSFVLKIGELNIAMDCEIASEIYVKQIFK